MHRTEGRLGDDDHFINMEDVDVPMVVKRLEAVVRERKLAE